MNNFLLLCLAKLGPVRDLQCHYEPLNCKWDEPEQPNGQIINYNINLTHNGMLILNASEKDKFWSLKIADIFY